MLFWRPFYKNMLLRTSSSAVTKTSVRTASASAAHNVSSLLLLSAGHRAAMTRRGGGVVGTVCERMQQHLLSTSISSSSLFGPTPVLRQRKRHRQNVLVYLDIAVSGPATSSSSLEPEIFRLEIELFSRDCPVAARNFEELCTGEQDGAPEAEAASPSTAASVPSILSMNEGDARTAATLLPRLSYKHTTIHRLVKGFLLQGGDLHSGEGLDQHSVYGERTFDAPEETKKSASLISGDDARAASSRIKGLVGTAVSAPHLNGSQFFVLTTNTARDVAHLRGNCIIFGQVTANSMEMLDRLEAAVPVGGGDGMPREGYRVEVVECGKL